MFFLILFFLLAWQIQRKICLPKLQVIVAAGDSFPFSFDGLSLFQMSWFLCPSLCSCVFFSSTGWLHKSSQSQFYFRAKSTSNCVSELTSIQAVCSSLLLESPCFFPGSPRVPGIYSWTRRPAFRWRKPRSCCGRANGWFWRPPWMVAGRSFATTGPTGRPGPMKALQVWPN